MRKSPDWQSRRVSKTGLMWGSRSAAQTSRSLGGGGTTLRASPLAVARMVGTAVDIATPVCGCVSFHIGKWVGDTAAVPMVRGAFADHPHLVQEAGRNAEATRSLLRRHRNLARLGHVSQRDLH